ncbi:DUF4276 family protein [Persephonella sp.]
MSYKYIYIVVEGQTEEEFIKRILDKYFEKFSIHLIPIIIETSRTPRKKHKGGLTTYSHLKKDILKLLHQSHIYKVSTMIDYYGLPDDFPEINSIPNGNIYQKVEYLEEKLAEDINNPKFIPYIQIHEFEASLFSSIDGFKSIISNLEVINRLQQIIDSYPNPEEINDNPDTHPSKRIENVFPDYNKMLHDIDIIEAVGIEVILQKCKHFREWIEKLK